VSLIPHSEEGLHNESAVVDGLRARTLGECLHVIGIARQEGHFHVERHKCETKCMRHNDEQRGECSNAVNILKLTRVLLLLLMMVLFGNVEQYSRV